MSADLTGPQEAPAPAAERQPSAEAKNDQPTGGTAGKAEAPEAPSKQPSDGSGYRVPDPAEFGRNMARVAAKSQRLISEFMALPLTIISASTM